MPQERRGVNLPTDVYDDLSYLQAEVRLALRDDSVEYMLSKTSMTTILKTLIKNADPKELAGLLK